VNLAEFAGACKALAERAEADLARECAQAAAREYLAALHVTTPVLTGALRESEHVMGVTGGGPVAVAEVGSELIYARFRNFGGTIHSKGPWPLRNRATGQVFGRSVTQAGSHYIENAEAWAEGPIRAACQARLDEMIRL
jgi:hypothetical protein